MTYAGAEKGSTVVLIDAGSVVGCSRLNLPLLVTVGC